MAGAELAVIGHALFNPRLAMPPLICAGFVSKVVCSPVPGGAEPIMLITTATVHPGCVSLSSALHRCWSDHSLLSTQVPVEAPSLTARAACLAWSQATLAMRGPT